MMLSNFRIDIKQIFPLANQLLLNLLMMLHLLLSALNEHGTNGDLCELLCVKSNSNPSCNCAHKRANCGYYSQNPFKCGGVDSILGDKPEKQNSIRKLVRKTVHAVHECCRRVILPNYIRDTWSASVEHEGISNALNCRSWVDEETQAPMADEGHWNGTECSHEDCDAHRDKTVAELLGNPVLQGDWEQERAKVGAKWYSSNSDWGFHTFAAFKLRDFFQV